MSVPGTGRPYFVCPHCGATYPEPAKYCWLCGKPLSTQAGQPKGPADVPSVQRPTARPNIPSKNPSSDPEKFNGTAYILLALFGLIISGTQARSRPIALLLLTILCPIILSVLPARAKTEQELPAHAKKNTPVDFVRGILGGIVVVIGGCILLGFAGFAVLWISCMAARG